jgi:four helix bundle protein
MPEEERYGITAQLRRAALSVPTNIAEGYNRKGNKEFSRFLDISLGSLAEVEYLIEFSIDIGFIPVATADPVRKSVDTTGRLIWGLQRSKRKDA